MIPHSSPLHCLLFAAVLIMSSPPHVLHYRRSTASLSPDLLQTLPIYAARVIRQCHFDTPLILPRAIRGKTVKLVLLGMSLPSLNSFGGCSNIE